MRYENEIVMSHCPVCSTTAGKMLYSFSSDQATQHYVLQEVDPDRFAKLKKIIERLWSGKMCRLINCDSCDFVYADPFVAGDYEFYKQAYIRGNYPKNKWEFRRTIEALKSLVEINTYNAPTLLEIGAGNGQFISMVSKKLIAPENIVCTEYSDYGIAEIKMKNIRCIQENILNIQLDTLGLKFDIVCLFQVLEHMDDIHQLFRVLNNCTNPCARIFVAVPNETRMAFNELNGSLLDLSPNHVGRWTTRAFVVLAEKHGWRIENHEIESESIVAKSKQYVKYRYMREMQRRGSFANRAEQIQSVKARMILRVLIAGIYTAAKLPSLIKLLAGRGLGNSQWVQMVKVN